MRPRAFSKSGFTLLEIIIAVGIFAGIFIAFFPVLSQSMAFTREIRDYSVLISLAELVVHEYMVKADQNVSGGPISFLDEDITETVKTQFPNELYAKFPDFRVFGTLRPSVLCENGGYEIAVKVAWNSEGRKKSFSLFTTKAIRK
jgi:prepilin-type N-terminal cleavage/methylation domain-containing protein